MTTSTPSARRACAICAALTLLVAAAALPALPRRAAAQEAGAALRVRVDWRQAPLGDLVVRFAEWTGKNYVLIPSDLAAHTLTVYAPRPVSLAEAEALFLSALHLKGFAVERSGAFHLIRPID